MFDSRKITNETHFARFPDDPPGKCIAFLNGNTLDCRKDNLMWLDIDFVNKNYPGRLHIINPEDLEDDDEGQDQILFCDRL